MIFGRTRSSHKTTGIILMAMGLSTAAVLIFLHLGSGSLDLRDEALTAGRSLYIYNTGNILNLHVNGELSIRKPPLVYLLTAISYHIFGINELGLRIPNAVFGLAIFAITAWASWRLAGPLWGGLSPWILLGCFNIIRVSREALTDTTFVFGTTLALMSLAVHLEQALSSSDTKSKGITLPILFATGLATALLSKGPLGLVVPIFSLPFIFFSNRKLLNRYIIASIAGTAPFIIWFAAQALRSSQFLSIYLGEEYLERIDYDSAFLTQFIRPPTYYLSNLWRWFRLSGLFAVVFSVWILLCNFGKGGHELCSWGRRPSLIFSTGAWIVFFILMSFVSHKSRRYILPIFPLMTLVTVCGFRGFMDLCKTRICIKTTTITIAMSIAVGFAALGNHYEATPDYLPIRKDAALKTRTLAEKGFKIYSDDPRLAPILHFYTNMIIPLLEKDHIPHDKRWALITGSKDLCGPHALMLNQDYCAVIHD